MEKRNEVPDARNEPTIRLEDVVGTVIILLAIFSIAPLVRWLPQT